jgi:hypothetical protein
LSGWQQKLENKKIKMKLKVRYQKDGQIETYSNVTLVGKFPNITEGVRNKGFQVINEDGEPRRFCYHSVVSVEAE